jgi:hypothetical protein
LFAPNSVATRALIQDAVTSAISATGRVKLGSGGLSGSEPTLCRIRIRYLLAGNPSPQNLVFPFYLDEGNA